MPEDESEDSTGKKSPIILGFEEEKKPTIRAHPPFVTNREYVPSLLVFALFVFLVYGAQWLASKSSILGFVAATTVFVFLAEWERHARHQFGRIRQRAHFDPLSLVKLPVPSTPPNIEIEPETPWIPHNERARTDPATILKRAQDTISGGGQGAEGAAQSAMELALISLLRRAAAIKEAEARKDEQGAESEDNRNESSKSPTHT